ncbi:MAG: LD-carboxypeptidase [Anaerolineales bacterium]|nr:LD-carboxypeptidase [Anaerolineales bacterium]
MIKPQKLQPGDKIATVSLSWGGPGAIPHRYQAGKKQLQEQFGLTVVEMPHTLKEPGWLHRNPQARAEDLMTAFSDTTIAGIVSTIGGDDSIRLLPYLDLAVIRSNPKVFIGYSDTTIAHLACFKAGLVTFYGPAIMAGFAENAAMFPYMIESVRKTLFHSEPVGIIAPNTNGWTVEMLDWANPTNQTRPRKLRPSTGWRFLQGQGVHRGHLIGGCFEVLDWLRGTDFWPHPDAWQDAILFIETSEDAPSPEVVKYGLRTYAALGILHRLSGILFGRPGGQISLEKHPEYDQALLQVVAEETGMDNLPIIAGMDFGHTDPMFVLPYGIQAEINCETQQFAILENAVTE